MNSKLTYIILSAAAVFTFASATAQEKKAKKAGSDFENYAYAEAIESYESLVAKGYSNEDIFKNLGNAHYQNANYEAAAGWYGKLFALEGMSDNSKSENKSSSANAQSMSDNSKSESKAGGGKAKNMEDKVDSTKPGSNADIDPEYLYRYAQSLKSLGKYEESDQWMQRFEAAKADDARVAKFKENFEYLDAIAEVSGRYDIENLPINTEASDFAPSLYGDALVFSSARTSKGLRKAVAIHEWNNEPFLNLFRSIPDRSGNFIASEKLSGALNKKTHESSTAFTEDGKTVYFTRNNSENGKFARDEGGLSRLKVYRASLDNGNWTDIIELPFNGADFSVAHPALSADEKKLYFASDMPGTLGQSDIFVVDIKDDGSFGVPRNLGSEINTEGRETFPFVTRDNVLYFASDGHPGLGGLDVFATKIDDLDNLYIVNVGEPVNSKQDDFSFIMAPESAKGFFASNREGGLGSDDIYGFTETKHLNLDKVYPVEGMVKNEDAKEALGGAEILILNNDGATVAKTRTSDDGSFSLTKGLPKGNYRLSASKEGYRANEASFRVGRNESSAVEVLLEKDVKQAEIGTDLIAFLDLSPVYFDNDKAIIRPDAESTLEKIFGYMTEFPELKIEVRSHTDAKAGTRYNKRLSDKRAEATVAYLVDKGLAEERVSGKGFGETQLMNDCDTREACEDSGHQLNRRSEFVVVE